MSGVRNFKGRAWSALETERLRTLLECGASYSQIAKKLGRSRSAIAGAIMRLREREALEDQVADLLALDMSIDRIALKLGLTRRVVVAVLARFNARFGEQAA